MPALISTVRLDERRRHGGINVRRPLAGMGGLWPARGHPVRGKVQKM